jgi:DNA-binding LacI/PurR family transcriptional regulator
MPRLSPENRAATLSDVAKAAGVSIATASYVLSNRSGVKISAGTRERVNSSAMELKYRRNALGAALRGGAAREVVLFSTERPQGVLSEVAFACAETAAIRGLSAVLHVGNAGALEPGRYDGVIILNTGGGGSIPSRLADGSVPVVEIFGSSARCQVHADDFGGARKGVEHLLSLGHRRIGHFAGPQSHPAYQERLRGFLDAVHEAGLRMDATPVIHAESELAEKFQAPNRPTGILAYGDESAVATYRQARAAGIAVPSDLSVVGFDDEAYAGALAPALTTLRIAPDLLAGSAFALLERQFEREEVPTQTLVPTSLVVRDSTTVS